MTQTFRTEEELARQYLNELEQLNELQIAFEANKKKGLAAGIVHGSPVEEVVDKYMALANPSNRKEFVEAFENLKLGSAGAAIVRKVNIIREDIEFSKLTHEKKLGALESELGDIAEEHRLNEGVREKIQAEQVIKVDATKASRHIRMLDDEELLALVNTIRENRNSNYLAVFEQHGGKEAVERIKEAVCISKIQKRVADKATIKEGYHLSEPKIYWQEMGQPIAQEMNEYMKLENPRFATNFLVAVEELGFNHNNVTKHFPEEGLVEQKVEIKKALNGLVEFKKKNPEAVQAVESEKKLPQKNNSISQDPVRLEQHTPEEEKIRGDADELLKALNSGPTPKEFRELKNDAKALKKETRKLTPEQFKAFANKYSRQFAKKMNELGMKDFAHELLAGKRKRSLKERAKALGKSISKKVSLRKNDTIPAGTGKNPNKYKQRM